MSKKSGRHLSKKGLIGLKRITLDNTRVFEYNGQHYKTLRDVLSNNPIKK